ncbi:MAG: hypothetical protein LBQ44_07475 [Treponema sp.]|jgi:hypothetical protein|nr:hypothetical protein [Treponema sp.]
MKLRIAVVWAMVLLGGAGAAFAEGFVLSGTLDSTVSFAAGAGPFFSFNIEEYANLRMQTKIKDRAVFYGAFNAIAASGTSVRTAAALGLLQNADPVGLVPSPFVAGENYAAALELERLYFRLNGGYADIDAGLMRLAFGYGQAWGPSDFLNPRNPLFPDARPRAILGSAVSFYPVDTVKLLAFGAAPKNPLNGGGEGFLFGLSGDKHWDRASLQVLYAYETPAEALRGIHRGGLSLKAELELGFVADLLYTYDDEAKTGVEGLAAAAGFDYSFFDGDFYILAEYLYSGAASTTALTGGGRLSNRHYLYGMILYRLNDYTNFSLACIAGFDDLSFAPILGAEYELFQGLTLSLSGQVPLDRDTFSGDGNRGELGPGEPKRNCIITAKARLRL